MKIIFFTISRGSLIRNFFQTGIISKILDKGIKVVVLTPQYKEKEIFAEYRHKNLYFEPLINSKPSWIDKILMEFGKGAVYSKTVLARYKYRDAGSVPNKFLCYPRRVFFFFFRFIPGIKMLIRKIGLVLLPQYQHDYLFEKYHPDLLFVTDYMSITDIAVMKSAKRFNVKIVGMPKSWDNMSKFLFRVKSDILFSWGDFCRNDAIKYQGYKDNEIINVGVPQFDYYQKKNQLSREDFCAKIGLDKDKKIIFYGSTGRHCPDEYKYVDLVLDFIEEEKINAQVLVRPHPGYLEDEKKFSKYNDNPLVVVYKNKQQKHFRDNWDISNDHLCDLYNSIYHAEVCINIASTLTLDSVAIGTPVINIYFDADEEKKDINDSILRLYKPSYIQDAMLFGASWVARSWEGYYKALNDIVIKGKEKSEMVEKMRNHFLYNNDNKAGDRVVENILNYIN